MKYSKMQIKKAGKILKSDALGDERTHALDILTYYRQIHGQLIEKLQGSIFEYAQGIDPQAIIAKRLKRTPSIIRKLKRLNTIQLSTMQDIAGLRIIVESMPKLNKLLKKNQTKSFY